MNLLPWARAQWDRVAAWVCVAAGGLAVVLGWAGVSREPLTAQQIPYVVSGGIGGLFLLGLGATLWLSADLRDEWRKLDRIERAQAVAKPAVIPAEVTPDASFGEPAPTVSVNGHDGNGSSDGETTSRRRRSVLSVRQP